MKGGKVEYPWKSNTTVTASRSFAGFLDMQISQFSSWSFDDTSPVGLSVVCMVLARTMEIEYTRKSATVCESLAHDKSCLVV